MCDKTIFKIKIALILAFRVRDAIIFDIEIWKNRIILCLNVYIFENIHCGTYMTCNLLIKINDNNYFLDRN